MSKYVKNESHFSTFYHSLEIIIANPLVYILSGIYLCLLLIEFMHIVDSSFKVENIFVYGENIPQIFVFFNAQLIKHVSINRTLKNKI